MAQEKLEAASMRGSVEDIVKNYLETIESGHHPTSEDRRTTLDELDVACKHLMLTLLRLRRRCSLEPKKAPTMTRLFLFMESC